MRLTDLLALSFSSLRQHKLRTVLTTLGVLFGSLVLAATLAVGQGVQQAIRSLVDEEMLRRVEIWPDWDGKADKHREAQIQVEGQMSEERRERLRSALASRLLQESGKPRINLSEENLAKLARIEHVQSVVPIVWQDGYAVLDGQSQPTDIGAARHDDETCRRRIVAGRFFNESDRSGIVVSEALLYMLGKKDESAMNSALGNKIRIELRVRKRSGLSISINHPVGTQQTRQESQLSEMLTSQLPAVIDKFEIPEAQKDMLRSLAASQPAAQTQVNGQDFTIVGVIRARNESEREERFNSLQIDGDVILPFQSAAQLFFRLQGTSERSLHRAALIADREENVERVLAAARELGYEAHALLEHLNRARLMYLLVFAGMTCVAVVSLLVAGLGIANIMLIGVLQRTREIGIMKAIGADSRHLQLMFLIEGAIIGLSGSSLGLLSAWALSFPADAWTHSVASRNLKMELAQSLWTFPPWVCLTVICVAVAVTVIAAAYPSRRAARVDPVTALRHE